MAEKEENGSERLAELFEKLRSTRVAPTAKYATDDVIAVLCLLARGYNVAEIERRTYITRPRIQKWRDLFLDGVIEDLYPDIKERMANFDLNLLPPERVRRVRPLFAWQQSQTRLEDRPNPYANGKGRGNGHGRADPSTAN